MSFFVSGNYAFADVTITTASGSGAPGCEETSSGCYYPRNAGIEVGESIIFSNIDTAAHTWTSGTPDGGPDGVFDTSLVMSGSSFEWIPSTPGEYPYFCLVHPWMIGSISVIETAETLPTYPGPAPSGTDVTIPRDTDVPGCENSNSCYLPYRITTDVGETITWYNADAAAHTITSGTPSGGPDGAFDSSIIMAGSSFSWRPSTVGEYPYFCMVHPWMLGTVTVAEKYTPPTYTPPISSSGKISVLDKTVTYSITGGKLYGIVPDMDANSLIHSIGATTAGSLTVSIPRTLLDATFSNGVDDDFFVLVHGEEVDFDERKTSFDRTLTIDFPARAEEIEIIGTFVSGYGSSPSPTPSPTPYVPTPTVPSGMNIIIPSGTGAPGCGESNACYTPYKFTVGKGSTVTWFNADTAAHTVTSGRPDSGPSDSFDSSLFMSGQSFSHKFDRDGTYPYFCMVHPWMQGYVIVQRGGPVISPPAPTPTPTPTPTPSPGTLFVSTDDSQYAPNDLVTVKVSTSQSANVAVSVLSPSGDSIVSRSVTTNSAGSGSLQFKLPDSSQSGSYRIDSTATISGKKISDSASFTVKSDSARISIISLQPTDQQGNAVSSFSKGKLGFVKVVLNSDNNADSLITINLFDDELTSLGIGSFKTTLGSGQSEMTLSFFIPNDASSGSGDIYANVFSDWPSQGGVPLTGESSTQVRIQ